MTPYEIDILMWYYTRANDHPQVSNPAPIFKDTIDRLIALDLLAVNSKGDQSYVAKPRAQIYCEALTEMPLPEYRMPEFKNAQ